MDETAKTWLAWVLVGLLVLCFVSFCFFGCAQPHRYTREVFWPGTPDLVIVQFPKSTNPDDVHVYNVEGCANVVGPVEVERDEDATER